MKKIVVLLSFIFIASYCVAQKKPAALPPKLIPNFKILTTDSTWFNAANLKKNKPVMIIYFAPDCGHCQKMMYDLKPYLKQLANVQVVMVTYSQNYDIRGLKVFKRDFDLKKYPNFTLGTEGYTAVVQQYYEVQTTPFIAMYHANGKWAKYIPKEPKAKDIMAAVRAL